MSEFASSSYTVGQLNAIIKVMKKQGGEDGPERFLRGDLILKTAPKRWIENDGIFYFTVASKGVTGRQWIDVLEEKESKIRIDDKVKAIICSRRFKPTNGIARQIKLIKGSLFTDKEMTLRKISSYANQREAFKLSVETAVLIAEYLTCEDLESMGLFCICAITEQIFESSSFYGCKDFLCIRAEKGAYGHRYIQIFIKALDPNHLSYQTYTGFAFQN